MILSNIEMQEAMELGRLEIRPMPSPQRPEPGQKCPYDTHSVNLTLSNEISIPLSGPFSFDLAEGGDFSEFLSRNSARQIIAESGYALKRLHFVLGRTVEYINLPLDHPVNQERK